MTGNSMRRGFTLLEMSIVITIIAVILASGMSILIASATQAQFNTTVATMNIIDQTLQQYAVAFDRLPCPANITLTPASTSYGFEVGTAGVCGSANNVASSGVAEGGVPTTTLRLSDSFMYDGWGHKIRYAVDPSLTSFNSVGATGIGANAALPPPLGGSFPSTSGVTVYDYTYNTVPGVPGTLCSTCNIRTNQAAYVLVSHGSNGFGGYTTSGLLTSGAATNIAEEENCHCKSGGTVTYDGAYVQQAAQGSGSTAYNDIVYFKLPSQLRAQSSILNNPAYIVAASSGTSGTNATKGLYVYVTNTSTWSCLAPSSTTCSGNMTTANSASLNTPAAVTADSSGNIYVADSGAGKILEYPMYSNGKFGSATTLYTISGSNGVAVDGNGAVWSTAGSTVYLNGSATAFTNSGSIGTILADSLYADKSNQNQVWVADKTNKEIWGCPATNSQFTATAPIWSDSSCAGWYNYAPYYYSAASNPTMFGSINGFYVSPQNGTLWVLDLTGGTYSVTGPSGSATVTVTPPVLWSCTPYNEQYQAYTAAPYYPIYGNPGYGFCGASASSFCGVSSAQQPNCWQYTSLSGIINTTSSSSVLIGTGSKTFTVATGLSFTQGMPLYIFYTTSPTADYMYGTVTSYNSGTGALVLNITSITGSGTYALWTISSATSLGDALVFNTLRAGYVNNTALTNTVAMSGDPMGNIWLAQSGVSTLQYYNPNTGRWTVFSNNQNNYLSAGSAVQLNSISGLWVGGGGMLPPSTGSR